MDLIAFRVKMYKGILDSGWIEVNPLTVFVGKNESGKTTLLKALHKLNPYNPDPYQMEREWPRAHRKGRSEKQEVCRARFRLSDRETSDLGRMAECEDIPDFVEVSRNYAGELTVEFEEDFLSDEHHPGDVDKACYSLPEIPEGLGDPIKHRAGECLEDARRLAHEGQLTELTKLVQKHKSLLREVRSPVAPLKQIESKFVNCYGKSLKQFVQTLEQLPTIRSKAHEYVKDHLPTFVYMSDYRAFSGTAQLDEIKVRHDQNRLTDEDNTFLALLTLSGLNLDELVDFDGGNPEHVEQRQFDLDDGPATLTSKISNRLRQRQYEVWYRADGQRFFTFVKDNHDPALIRLEERSKGFQWFFSFDLMLMHESGGSFEGCVVLLDEPGLHLHPDAQKDLLLRLDHYAEGNTLLYTTHLPFMIDLNYPDRIRVLMETENGIVVTTDFTESPPEAKRVFQAALGMNASQCFVVAQRNLVVEGVNEYRILTKLSNLLQQDGKRGLPEDVLTTPGGSSFAAVNIATFMTGQGLEVVALFDSDDEGRSAQVKLVKTWLAPYKTHQTKSLLLGDAVGTNGNFAIEDLFSEDFFAEVLMDAYSKQLALANVNEISLRGEGMIWERIERFMEDKGIEITKESLAIRVHGALSKMTDASDLPNDTRRKAITLFSEIRSAFEEGEIESS